MKTRARIIKYTQKDPFYKAEIEILEDNDCTEDKKCEALVRSVRKTFDEYINLSGNIPAENIYTGRFRKPRKNCRCS